MQIPYLQLVRDESDRSYPGEVSHSKKFQTLLSK